MKLIDRNSGNNLNGLDFLSGTAIKFASSDVGKHIYQFIAESLKELNPNAIVIVNSLDSNQEISTTEAFISPSGVMENIITTLGFNPVGKTYKIDSSILELKSGSIRKFEQGIHELSFRTIPKVISRSLEKLINMGSIYGIAFMIDNRMYANSAMIFRKGDDISHIETIETFVRQATVTLKRLEAEHNEEKFRSLFEFMNQGAFNIDAGGKVTDVNRAALELLGISQADFLNKKNIGKDWDIIDEYHKNLDESQFPASVAFSSGKSVKEQIIGVFNPLEGDYKWLLVNAMPQFNQGNNSPSSVFVTFQDITSLRRAIHVSKDYEANARAIMESTDDVIILLDKKGNVIDSNEAHANRLNTTRESLIGKNVFKLLPKETGEERFKKVTEVIKSGKPVFGEDFRGGYWNEYSIHPIVSHKGKVESVAVFAKDITERKLAQDEISKNYTLLRIAGETAKFGGWIVDLKKNIVIWSDVVAKIHEVDPGFSPTVEQGIEFYAPEWRAKIMEIFRNCAEKGIPYDQEMEIITASGKRKWVRTNGEAVRDETGNIVKVHGAFQDISDYKSISEALIAYERKFKSSIDSLLDAFGMYTAVRDNNNIITDFRIDYINPKGCELNRMSMEDQIGKGLCEILPAHRKIGLFDEYVKLVESGNTIEKESVVFEDSYSGVILRRIFEIKASKFGDGFIATWRDISVKRETEDRLIESEREKASLIDNLPGFVYKCALDHNWTMFYISDKCFEVTGYKPEDLIQNKKISYNDVIHPQYREFIWEKWQSVLTSETFFQEEYKIVTADGKTKWVWEQGRGVYDKRGELTHLEGFIADITYRKEIEEALRDSEASLAQLNATKDKFFSIIAHDLKSPFNSIMGIGELLIEQIKKREYDGLEEYANIMRDSSQKAMSLLSNLLEWSRTQTGRMEFNPEYVRLSQIAYDAIDLLQSNANQKQIEIKSLIPNSTICFADKAMVSTVLRNLISNAVKFTQKGGVVKISCKSSESNYVVTVSDNGIGMSPKEVETLFRLDEFYSSRGTDNEMGTGLGLILCKEFISKHGCEIWAESSKGTGSSFSFTLPRKSQ